MLSDLALLTGADAGELLAAAVRTDDGELQEWTARQVDVRPGVGTTVSYRARVTYSDGERTVWLGASTRTPPDDTSGALTLSDGDRSVTVWPWPRDPWLPALPPACSSTAVAELLTSFGALSGRVRLRVHAYRPTRRAVLEGRTDRAGLFVKVLGPERVQALHERHRLLHGAGLPVPPSLGWSGQGLLVLPALGGTPMRERLRAGSGAVPTAACLLALLDRMPAELLEVARRPSWTDGARHYAGVVGAALPAEASRAQELAEQVLDGLRSADTTPQPVHGDLYEAQLLLGDDGRVTGLLDVDSAGPGRRADDLGCLLAHLDVLADLEPGHAAPTRALMAQWQAGFEERVDPVELRLRTAGVLLSLATGPHRVREPDWPAATTRRLDLVEQWVRAAGGAAS